MSSFLWENFFKKDSHPIHQFLQEQPLFATLTAKEIQTLKRILHHRTYFPGEVIFKPGAQSGFYMILKGEVRIFYNPPDEKEENLIQILKAGDFFGELSLVQEKGYQKTLVKTKENTELLTLFKPELTSLTEKYPKTGLKIITKLADILGTRLQKAGEKLSQLSSKGMS